MSSGEAALGTVETRVPARLDRLPWSRFHWLVVIGLGTVWILDGLEVTMVGSVASRLTESGSGIKIDASQIGTAAAFYVAGACLGALFFGQLTDRFGRKRLFILTLGLYITATVATAFSFAPWYFFLARFFTGAGIGGEYAAINSAIDELIPARVRGRVDLIINGSYWLGAAGGGVAALFFLNKGLFAANVGWRLAFGVGAVFGLAIMIVRRHVPESPRWLFIHGREEEAERIVDQIEAEVLDETGQQLEQPGRSIRVRQRLNIPFREIARVAFQKYPERAVLGLALFVGQAFLYNAVTFDLGTILSKIFGVASGSVPFYTVIFAVGNLLGPVLLGRLFDTVGRKPMVAGSYLVSAALTAVLAFLMTGSSLTSWSFIALVGVTFFFASAGASAAYLTVSEIFPMETRALAIAFFYAVGTAAGGIAGPLLFGHLIQTGRSSTVAIGFFIGAGVMAVGGIVELMYGVKAEGRQLEDIAEPLTAEEAKEEPVPAAPPTPVGAGVAAPAGAGAASETSPEVREALRAREHASEERARAAEHRAAVHELRAQSDGGDGRARDRAATEAALAEIADLRANEFDERAVAHDERAAREEASDPAEQAAAGHRADAAEERARAHEARARSLTAEHESEAERYAAFAEAAGERARAREHRARAQELRGQAQATEREAEANVLTSRAEVDDQWAEMHSELARSHLARADRDAEESERHEQHARELEQLGLAAEQRVGAAEQRAAATDARGRGAPAEEAARYRAEAEERERRAQEREQRIRDRIERRRQRERMGLRRYRPGPGTEWGSPGMPLQRAPVDEEDLDREIDAITRAVDEQGAIDRQDLARRVGARYWGPGRFAQALREAVGEGRIRRLSRRTFAPAEQQTEPAGRQ